jgi:hypothetical protein
MDDSATPIVSDVTNFENEPPVDKLRRHGKSCEDFSENQDTVDKTARQQNFAWLVGQDPMDISTYTVRVTRSYY